VKKRTGGCVRFEVMTVNGKVVIVWNIIPCGLIDNLFTKMHVMSQKTSIIK
jgi:hypothetical protein